MPLSSYSELASRRYAREQEEVALRNGEEAAKQKKRLDRLIARSAKWEALVAGSGDYGSAARVTATATSADLHGEGLDDARRRSFLHPRISSPPSSSLERSPVPSPDDGSAPPLPSLKLGDKGDENTDTLDAQYPHAEPTSDAVEDIWPPLAPFAPKIAALSPLVASSGDSEQVVRSMLRSARRGTTGRALVCWSASTSSELAMTNARLSYVITVQQLGSSTFGEFLVLARTQRGVTSIIACDLTPGMPYVFRVAARNGAGIGAYSEPSAIFTVPETLVSVPSEAQFASHDTPVPSFSVRRVCIPGSRVRVRLDMRRARLEGAAGPMAASRAAMMSEPTQRSLSSAARFTGAGFDGTDAVDDARSEVSAAAQSTSCSVATEGTLPEERDVEDYGAAGAPESRNCCGCARGCGGWVDWALSISEDWLLGCADRELFPQPLDQFGIFFGTRPASEPLDAASAETVHADIASSVWSTVRAGRVAEERWMAYDRHRLSLFIRAALIVYLACVALASRTQVRDGRRGSNLCACGP